VLLRRVGALVDLLLVGLHNRLAGIEIKLSAIDELTKQQAALAREVTELAQTIGRIEARNSAVANRLADLAEASRTFAERTTANEGKNEDRPGNCSPVVEAISAQIPAPAILVGDRLLVSRIKQFVMAMPAEDVILASLLTMYGSIDVGLELCLSRLLRPGMTFVDVGAHIGIHTLRAASQVGLTGHVYSFEPAPRLFEILSTNVALNGFGGRVIAEQKAVSNTRGTARLLLKKQTGHNTLFGSPEDGDGVVEVSTVSLDAALGGLESIDIVKVDAEGAEPAVLQGMKGLLVNHPSMRLIIEFAPSLLLRAGIEPRDFAHEIGHLGFHFHRIDDMTGELAHASIEELLSIESSNLFLDRAPHDSAPM
jgi:FkbM family methyltransferase